MEKDNVQVYLAECVRSETSFFLGFINLHLDSQFDIAFIFFPYYPICLVELLLQQLFGVHWRPKFYLFSWAAIITVIWMIELIFAQRNIAELQRLSEFVWNFLNGDMYHLFCVQPGRMVTVSLFPVCQEYLYIVHRWLHA